jgi:hypothetical protein
VVESSHRNNLDDEDEGVLPSSPPSSLGDTPPIPAKRQRRMEIDEDHPPSPIHFMVKNNTKLVLI